jgi:hypothetical protein
MLRLRSLMRRPTMLALIAVALLAIATTTAWCGGIATLLR